MMARFSFHQARGIVHPGIVAARVATTDQAQRSRSGVRRDGAQALEAVASFGPDLILSDWNMPNMTGIEFLTKEGKETEIPAHLDHPTFDERVHYLEEYWSNDVKYAFQAFKSGVARSVWPRGVTRGSSSIGTVHRAWYSREAARKR